MKEEDVEFTSETRDLFDHGGYCPSWESGRNDSDALHHILGRISNSPYNAAPLNNRQDHMPEGRTGLLAIHSEEVRRKYLQRTKRYLDSIGYQPTEADTAFLDKNKKYYAS
jgi:hypothetical protein